MATANKAIAPIAEFTTQMAQRKKQLASMLPEGLSPEKFMRTAVNGIKNHSDSVKLLNANRDSLFNSCQKAAGDGLMLDGREAALVVFGTEVTYMPMTQGLVKLARNSGEIGTIEAYIVYEQDEFQYRPGLDNIPAFSPDWKKAPSKRGEPMFAYAVIQLKDGDPITRIMHSERIYQIASGTRNARQYNPKTGAHYEEWWKKTVIKAALKYAPRSTELDDALEHDNENYDFEAAETTLNGGAAVNEPIGSVSEINDDLNEKPEPTKAAKAEPAKAKTAPKKEKVDTRSGEISDVEIIEPEAIEPEVVEPDDSANGDFNGDDDDVI